MLPYLTLGLMHLSSFAVAADCSLGTGALKCETGLPQTTASSTQIQSILAIVFGVIAALAVLMIVIAGFRFITAQGNPQEVTKARQTILYALAGLVISLSAEVIVAFVLGKA